MFTAPAGKKKNEYVEFSFEVPAYHNLYFGALVPCGFMVVKQMDMMVFQEPVGKKATLPTELVSMRKKALDAVVPLGCNALLGVSISTVGSTVVISGQPCMIVPREMQVCHSRSVTAPGAVPVAEVHVEEDKDVLCPPAPSPEQETVVSLVPVKSGGCCVVM